MSLPKIDTPTFMTTIPSLKKKIKFRQFVVKEEKILLIAQESKDDKQILDAVRQVINNCIISDVDVNDLTLFDIEYLLIQLRSKSVNNLVEFKITDDYEKQVDISIDLNDIQLITYPEHSNKVELGEGITLFLRYFKLDQMEVFTDHETSPTNMLLDLFVDALDKLVVGDEVYIMDEQTKEERMDFIDNLSPESMTKMKSFFDTTPKINHRVDYLDSKGEAKYFHIDGFKAFFI